MAVALFYYTLSVMLAIVLTAAVCLSSYLVSRRTVEIYACIGFIIYFFDVSWVFLDDFLVPKTSLQDRSVFFVGHPLLSVVSGAGLIGVCWLLVCTYLEEKRRRFVVIPVLIFLLISVGVLLFIPQGRWHQFLFYSARALMIFALLAFAAYRSMADRSEIVQARMSRHRLFFFVILGLTTLVVLQNVYFQLLADYDDTGVSPLLFFPERNFAENVLALTCAFYACRRALRTLAIRSRRPPSTGESTQMLFIDDNIDFYSDRNGLSERETDVLRLILLGKDGRAIATELFLSTSTVKVHVHNILQKTGCQNRQELVLHFWRVA